MQNITQVETGSTTARLPQRNSVRLGDVVAFLKSDRDVRVDVTTEERDGFALVHFDVRDETPGAYEIVVLVPFVDIEKTWTGSFHTWTGVEHTSIALNYSFETAANRFLPVVCNYNRAGQNRYLVGLLDHKPLTRVNQTVVVEHPMRELKITFARNRPRRETVVIGTQPAHFAEVVKRYVSLCRGQALPVPEWGREPVWCSWYAYVTDHKQHDIERELPALRAAGIRTVLIDAAWFGPYNLANIPWLMNRTGDFVPDRQDWPDMAGLVKRIHERGLRAMLWCAPLWVGPESDARKRMERFCVWDGQARLNRLCPHCTESIVHAREIVGRLMRDYKLDGLKIDFMDHVEPGCVDPAHDHSRQDFGEAMDMWMAGVREEIIAANPEAVIEYRVRYSNLVTQAHANAQRGNDAPYDADYIRRENTYLRLFVDPRQAVWSDYLYWHPAESLANIARRIGMMIFSGGVPTFSISFADAPKEQRDEVRRWLKFYAEHRLSLGAADLRVLSADSCYSATVLEDVASGRAYVLFSGASLPDRIELRPGMKEVWLLNASAIEAGRVQVVAGDKSRRLTVKTGRLARVSFVQRVA